MRHAIFLLLLLAAPGFAAEPVYTWRTREDDPDRVYLYRDGKQIGGWCYRARHYRPLDGDTWGPPIDASPVPPPDRTSISVSKIQQSPPRRRLLRPLQSRIDAGVQGALQEYVQTNAARIVGDAVAEALKSMQWRFYGLDLGSSAKLFAHIEMGGQLHDNPDSDDDKFTKDLMSSGSIRVFLAEKAKFIDKLRKEEFSDPVLATIYLELVDDDPIESKGTHARPEVAIRSVLLSRTRDWNEDPPATVAPDAPSVLLIHGHRTKDAKDKIPVTVHCSLMYLAQKEGKTFARSLHIDLYLETLESEGVWYPWKVKNVEYK
jgi:hypothetical protein